MPTSMPLGMLYGPIFISFLATLARLPVAGGHILRH